MKICRLYGKSILVYILQEECVFILDNTQQDYPYETTRTTQLRIWFCFKHPLLLGQQLHWFTITKTTLEFSKTNTMKVNQKLIEEIEQSGLPIEEALLFCAAVEMQRYGTLDWLVATSGIINTENEHKYRINLCNHDPETDSIKLRYPLFVTEQPDVNFKQFTEQLFARGVKYNGHVNTPLKYSILSATDEGAFLEFAGKIGVLDLNKLVAVTVNYYANTEYAKKLTDFLKSIAPSMYSTFEPNKSGLV